MRFPSNFLVLVQAAACIVVAHAAAAPGTPDPLNWLAQDPGNKAARIAVKESVAGVTNGLLRAKRAIAYCLACRYAGDWEEATRAEDYIERNFAKSPYRRYLAPTRTHEVCPHCLGDKRADHDCKKCRATGRCTSCRGSGKKSIGGFDGAEPGDCGVCAGSGACKVCDGEGKHLGICKVCAGKGSRSSKTKVHEALQAVIFDVQAATAVSVAGDNPIVAVLQHLDSLPESYRAADTTLKRDTVFRTIVAPIPKMFTGQVMTLTSEIKDVQVAGANSAYIATTGFRELLAIQSPDSAVGLSRGSKLHLAMSRDEAARLTAGQRIEVTGRLEYRPGYRSDVAVNYARDLPVVHLRFVSGGGESRKDIGQIFMKDYTCKIGNKRYASPLQ